MRVPTTSISIKWMLRVHFSMATSMKKSVEGPPSFEDDKKPNHVYKLKKALYGLKQAPRAWYERWRDFLLSKGFTMGKVDTTLFIKKIGKDLFILQIYVDDIIFGSTNQDFCEEFGKMRLMSLRCQ